MAAGPGGGSAGWEASRRRSAHPAPCHRPRPRPRMRARRADRRRCVDSETTLFCCQRNPPFAWNKMGRGRHLPRHVGVGCSSRRPARRRSPSSVSASVASAARPPCRGGPGPPDSFAAFRSQRQPLRGFVRHPPANAPPSDPHQTAAEGTDGLADLERHHIADEVAFSAPSPSWKGWSVRAPSRNMWAGGADPDRFLQPPRPSTHACCRQSHSACRVPAAERRTQTRRSRSCRRQPDRTPGCPWLPGRLRWWPGLAAQPRDRTAERQYPARGAARPAWQSASPPPDGAVPRKGGRLPSRCPAPGRQCRRAPPRTSHPP